MNITELRYLVAIRKWGSVSAAAKQLYAAQPNVSKALKNLEEEYGIRIFERSSTGMIPTEQGRHFIRQAERVLDEVDRLDLDARSRQSSCAELRVVLPHATYASYATVDFCSRWQTASSCGCISGNPAPWKHWTMCCGGAIIWPCCATRRRTKIITTATATVTACTGSR